MFAFQKIIRQLFLQLELIIFKRGICRIIPILCLVRLVYNLYNIDKTALYFRINFWTLYIFRLLFNCFYQIQHIIDYCSNLINMIKSPRRRKIESPKDTLKKELSNLIQAYVSDLNSINDFPTKWEKHGDLILLPSSCLQDPVWLKLGDKLWTTIATVLKAERVARKYKVKNDDYRSPNVELLLGSDGWVIHTDNKIKCTYDVSKCMFSCGNISEKLRIAKFSCEGETVVDLYAGIGYFTLPFLIHAKAALVHACEWNPDAVEALEKNLALNNVKEKCIIHFGDNRKVCPKRVADRVNLGLIPSSEGGWETACQALRPTGGILHIHGNVTSNVPSNDSFINNSMTDSIRSEWKIWSLKTSITIREILQSLYGSDWSVTVLEIIRIKPYAPHIDHLVMDVECKPSLCDAE